ncbi:MAG: dihydrolipoyl dehydrogenase [Polyangiales bacterium]
MTEKPNKIDVAIVGAGSAGVSAWRAAKKEGASVAMIDSGPLGTTCARVGCMPSKLLVAAADAAHHARQAGRFGVHSEDVRVEGREVLDRVRRERDRFVGFVLDVLDDARSAGELVEGRARIAGPGRLVVEDGTEVHYNRLVIATGSRPVVPPPFRAVEAHLLTNEDVFELDDLPDSMLVIGLGSIGLEIGQAFHRLGVRTTLLGIDGLIGPLADPLILEQAAATLSQELDMHTEYQIEKLERVDTGVRIRFVDSTGAERDETFERVLMAAGRVPNMDRLALENLGIFPNEAGRYDIDPDTLQLGDAPVFVAGDVNELHPVLHEAADDGRIAGRNAAHFPNVHAAWRRTPLSIVFTDPQIGIVGGGYESLTECEASAGELSFENQGRARLQGVNAGKLRIYGEQHTGRLLGAEIFGPSAEHLSHLLAWAVQAGMTVDDALAMPFYHPVVEEGIRTALRNLNANLRHGAPVKCAVAEMGVGC